jgi:hypothetical protein
MRRVQQLRKRVSASPYRFCIKMYNTLMRIRGRTIGATAVATVMLQVTIAVFATLDVCFERPHTHGGTAAPDCPMHHQPRDNASTAPHHAHHGQAMNTGVDRSAPQIACRCPDAVTQIYFGQIAILQAPPPRSPFVRAVPLDPPSDVPALEHHLSPPPPPPR